MAELKETGPGITCEAIILPSMWGSDGAADCDGWTESREDPLHLT